MATLLRMAQPQQYAPLQVGVAPPQDLYVGNQVIAPNPNARSGVAPPPIQGNAKDYLHGLSAGVLGGAEAAAANTARGLTDLRFLTPNFVPGVSTHVDPFIHSVSNKIAAPFHAGQQDFQNLIKQDPTVAAQKGAKVGNIVGQGAIYAPQAVSAARGAVQLATQIPHAIEAGGQAINKANELRTPLNAVGAVGKNVSGVGGESDPVIKAIANENKFKDQIQAMRQQAPNDNHFYENTILNNVEKPGDVGNFARHVARRVEGGGENPTNVLNDALQKTDLKAEAAAQQSAHVQELKSMVNNLEKSTGQKGLYSSVLKNMAGMNEKQQLDYLGKSLTSMRDNGVLAMDHLNKEGGFTPPKSGTIKPSISARNSPTNTRPSLSQELTSSQPLNSSTLSSPALPLRNSPPTPVSAVGKNVNKIPKDFLNLDPKAIAQNARILQTSKAKAAAALDKNVLPENKTLVNQRLSKMPAIPEVPKTSAVPGQELKPTQNLPVIQKLFANKVTALRQINTPSSHAAADRVIAAEADRQAMQAQWMHSIPTVRSLNKNEFGNFVDTVEKNAKAQSPKVAQAVKEWKTLTPQIAKTGQSQGFLLNGARQDYFPHQYDVIKEGSTKWDNQIQGLMDTRKINHETAVNILKSHNDDVKAGHAGSLENSRETTLPGYHKDIHAVNSYIGRAASRVADSRQFGIDAQVANKLVENIRVEGGDANTAEAALRNYLTNPDKGGTGSKVLSGARGVFGAASLSKAPISHLGQTSNTVVEAGIKNTLKGWGQFLGRNSGAKNFVDKTGVTNPQELHSYRNQYTSLKGGLSKVTAAGLTPVMKMNRSVTALAGRALGNHLASIGDTAKLEELGVTGKIGKTLTADQEVQAARGLSNHTMFSGSRATTPTFAETPTGKTVGQFRTAYAYKQTGFLYNQVIKEAGKGNIAPLARFLGVSSGVGGATVLAKNKISGNKEGPGGIAMDTLGALGGIPGELAVQAARYGSRAGNLTKTAAGAVAPLAGEAMTLGSSLDSLLHGKPAPLERTALKAIPLAGSRISNALLPPKAGPNAPKTATSPGVAPNNTTTTLSAKGKTVQLTKRELNATNPDELTRWRAMPAKAQANVFQANPTKYARDTQLALQQDKTTGNKAQLYKDQTTIANTQIKASQAQSAAQLKTDKAAFIKSGKDISTINGMVYQKGSDGKVSVMEQRSYDYKQANDAMSSAKDSRDVSGFFGGGNKLLGNISWQLQHATLTSANRDALVKKAVTVQNDLAKADAYSGFDKPKNVPTYNPPEVYGAREGYVSQIQAAGAKYGVDVNALISVAAQEGLGGGVGDNGTSFGPFQMHVGGALPPGKDQAWAESPAGIDYAVQQIAKVAGGKHGADAIQAIVTGFEKSANQPGEIQNALALYGGGKATLSPGAPGGSATYASVTGSSSSSSSTAKAKVPNFKTSGSVGIKPPKVGKISVKGSKAVPKFKSPKVATKTSTPKVRSSKPKALAKLPVTAIPKLSKKQLG